MESAMSDAETPVDLVAEVCDMSSATDPTLELTCYAKDGWQPLIRPAQFNRQWMDNTQGSYAYRCLPLSIANSHGWELLVPRSFEAVWDGGSTKESVQVRPLDGGAQGYSQFLPVSVFGSGVLTFHVEGVFRTPPGWNLFICGPINEPRDAISPLTGVVETDWSPFTFTMNWKFTRPGHAVSFRVREPFCHVFPVERGYLSQFSPSIRRMADNPEIEKGYEEWSASRNNFHKESRDGRPRAASETWQKHYFKGVDVAGNAGPTDHQTKLKVMPFQDARAS